MFRTFAVVAAVLTCVVAWPALALAGGHTVKQFGPGAPGIGDPYFPLDGNGGYDVKHYDLDVAYTPATDVLKGVATIRARATQNLSRFNLDLDGLTVRAITVDGRGASWSRDDGELTVTPKQGLRKHDRFTTVVRYDGVPEMVGDAEIGLSGFIHTDDGTLSPDSRRSQPPGTRSTITRSTKASYRFHITVPKGLEAIANGELKSRRSRHGSTTLGLGRAGADGVLPDHRDDR